MRYILHTLVDLISVYRGSSNSTRPAVSVLPFQLPMCEMDKEKSQYEVYITYFSRSYKCI